MPDRSLRLLTLPPQPLPGGHSGVLLRERPTSPPDAPSGGQPGDQQGGDGRRQDDKQDDNPFAPPPEGTPDRPWQPRRPSGEDDSRGSDEGGGRSPWGNQWSDRQPGRSQGGFGDNPRRGQDGPGGGGQSTGGMRWDPTDPAQRRARYALLSGMWAFFFALFSWPYVALPLGVLALYWGISSLRAKPRTPDPDNPAPQNSGRPQTTAAVSGLVTASLAIAVVAAGFAAQVVYSDYYTCRSDALTNEAQQACKEHLPKELRGVLGAES
ncbi:hypothetical protein [Streptomyces sp. NPDC093568]|uniref:hypothetical protein n=1 Tax=Streptomyces sp. NPDC093568 TaxID=3366041 RepID=UPI00380C5A44